MPLHVLSDERAQGNYAQVVPLRESEHCADQFRRHALSFKGLWDFSVYQAKQIPRPLVHENGSRHVNMKLEAVQSNVIGDFSREHNSLIVLCCSCELTSPERRRCCLEVLGKSGAP